MLNKYFHSFDKDGLVLWQGKILDKIDNLYLIQLYGWFTGEQTDQQLVTPEQMIGWSFYDNIDDWRSAGDAFFRKVRDYYQESNELPV